MGVQKVTDSMDKNAIELAIKSIGQRGASLDKDIQNTGLSILKHVNEHNEVSLFIKLYRSLPKGSRTNALVAWAIAFGKVVVNLDKATKKEFPFLCDKGKVTNIPAAMKKPWFDFKKPKDPSEEFSLEAEVAAFQAKVAGWIKSGKVSPTEALAIEVLRVKVEAEPAANEVRSEEVVVEAEATADAA